MTGLFFSTAQEASFFLKTYKDGRFDGLTEGDFAHDDQFFVAITGVGKIKATLRTERFLHAMRLARILHLGTSSRLNTPLPDGSMMAITQVFEGDRIELTLPLYPRMPLESLFPKLSEGTLVTQDHVPKDPKEKVYWQRIADISDMEGYAIAFVAASHGVPCHIVKTVIGESKNEDLAIKKLLNTAYQKMGQFLLDQIQLKAI